jgi:GNAT superfamily N-acetyltransferase
MMPVQRIKIDYTHVFIQYSIESAFMSVGAGRYLQQISGIIFYSPDMENADEGVEIGKIKADKLLLGEAANNGYRGFDVFDSDALVKEVGDAIYDFEKDDFADATHEHLDISFMDLLIVSRLEILPGYRGNDIGKYAIKDLYNNFIGGCGLITLKCFPLQLESRVPEHDPAAPKWTNDIQYDSMEADEEKSNYQLLAYYTSMGFKYIPEISDSLLFLNPAIINRRFNKIQLD